MTLYCTRAKSFVTSGDRGTKQFLLQPGPHPQPVPFWVAETPTFLHGIADKSIINLTPPEQMPGYKPVRVVEEPEDAAGDNANEEGSEPTPEPDDAEQTEAPQAPFGGQPMTPVSPAPKIGNVRSGSARAK